MGRGLPVEASYNIVLLLQIDTKLKTCGTASAEIPVRMKQTLIYNRPVVEKEYNANGNTACPDRPEMSKMRKLAQHYLNGLRISAFFIRHGFNRMRVKHIMHIYENWIYPFLYRN